MNEFAQVLATLERIADALERQNPPREAVRVAADADAFVWHTDPDALLPVASYNFV